jgi:hypothetical protein
MATGKSLIGREEERVRLKIKKGSIFFIVGIVFSFGSVLAFMFLPLNLFLLNFPFFIGCCCLVVGVAVGPTEEELALLKQEEQKRIQEQIYLDDQARKIYRDHTLGQIAQDLVAPKALTVVDPEQIKFEQEKAAIRRQWELEQYRRSLDQSSHDEVAQLRRQNELAALQRRERNNRVAYEIKELAEKIRTLKHLERDGLCVVEDLVEAKIIDAREAGLFKEVIKDKVLE